MKFKLDENLPREGAEVLRAGGHDAVTTLDQGLGGKPDEDVFAMISAEGRVLVTLDAGFGNIQAYPPKAGPGVVLLRLGSQSKLAVLSALKTLVAFLAAETPVGKLWVVEDERIRIRE